MSFQQVGNKIFLDTRLKDIFFLQEYPVRMNFHDRPCMATDPDIDHVKIYRDNNDPDKILVHAFSKVTNDPNLRCAVQIITVDTTSTSIPGFDGEPDYTPTQPNAIQDIRNGNTRWRVQCALSRLGATPMEPINY